MRIHFTANTTKDARNKLKAIETLGMKVSGLEGRGVWYDVRSDGSLGDAVFADSGCEIVDLDKRGVCVKMRVDGLALRCVPATEGRGQGYISIEVNA